MIVWQYDDDLIYVGTSECQRNPLRREEFLVPRNCTIIQPPDYNSLVQYLRFEDGVWKEYELKKIEVDPLDEVKELLNNPTKDNIKEAIYKLTRIL